MFAQFKAFKSTLHWGTAGSIDIAVGGTITGPAGNQVDDSCNAAVSLFISK